MNQDHTPLTKARRETVAGVLYAGGAFLIWGLSPVYWKAMQQVPALEIIAHRTVWALLFLIVLTLFQGRWSEFTRVLRDPAIHGDPFCDGHFGLHQLACLRMGG